MKRSTCLLGPLVLLLGCATEPTPPPREAELTPAATAPAADPAAVATAAVADAPADGEDPPCHTTLPAGDAVLGASLYQLTLPLTAQDGAARSWGDLSGGPVLASMVYTSCTTACPMIVSELKTVLSRAGRDDVRVLLVSMDPERDDPAALAAMAERHGLDDSWVIARSTEDGVRQWSAALGVRYRQLPDGQFNHSQVVALLDADGAIAARAEGLGPQRDDVIAALAKLPPRTP